MDKPELSDLIGVRFVDRGRNKDDGLDCWGLAMEVFRRYGIELPDFIVSAFDFKIIDEMAHEATGFNAWKEVGYVTNEDAPLVVLMRMHPAFITHAGVYIGDSRIIHTTQYTGAVISKVGMVQSRIAGYYRYVKDN